MSVWTAPSPSDIDRAAQRIADGTEIAEACRQEGFTLTRLRQTDRQAWAELRQLWHDVQGVEDRTTARDTLREVATKTSAEDKDRVAAAVHLGKASGYLADTQRVELTGSEGGPVQVEDRSATLGDIARILDASGALVGLTTYRGGTDRGDVPAAGEVLPVPPDS